MGPFTATFVVASILSVGSGVIVIFAAWAHLTASARFRVRAPGPVSGRLSRDRRLEDRHHGRGFPLPFGRRHWASRSSCSRRGVGPSSRSAYRSTTGPRTGLPRSARTSCDRVGRPRCPGDSGAHPDRGHFPAGACRFPATSPFPPPTVPPARMLLNEASTKGSHVFARPVFPSPVAARMEQGALATLTPGFAPRRPGAGRRTPRWRQAIEHGPGTTRSTHIGRSTRPPRLRRS